MATKIEQRIRHEQRRKGVLVPLLEDLFTRPIEIESEDDVEFIANLLRMQMLRQQNRTDWPLFSPSQMAECLRYVYLLKNHKALEIPRLGSVRIEPNYYFFNGNWIHLKWQFALYKLDKHVNDKSIFALIACEVPIVSKHKDHGGTVDALVLLTGEPVIVDFKGLNVRTFAEITRGYIPAQYAVQLADYGMLFNSQATKLGTDKITRALLVTENKGGPDARHPIALHESEIEIKTHLPEVRSRLEELRKHGREKTLPPPECTSTTTYQFQGCPFRGFCKEEVKRIERKRKRAEREDSAGLDIARPARSGNRRSRRNSD